MPRVPFVSAVLVTSSGNCPPTGRPCPCQRAVMLECGTRPDLRIASVLWATLDTSTLGSSLLFEKPHAFFLKNPTPIAHQPSASISGDYENARANDARNMRAHPHSTSCPPHPTFSIQDHIHILIHAIRRSGLFRAH